MARFKTTICSTVILTLAGCALPASPPKPVDAPVTKVEQQEAQMIAAQPEVKTFKRKVAIARFSNETRYGRTFYRDGDLDPLGKQASDMLSSRLIQSGAFIVLERTDLEKIVREQKITGQADLVGADTLILGSVTEFGRSTEGTSGFLSGTKKQTAKAKVEIRLVDPRTGHAYFSASGSGEASTETGQVAGFGDKAAYDATLNDRAIGAAVTDVMNSLVAKLEERPWRTDILKIQAPQVFISGGTKQGLKPGDILAVMHDGEAIKSGQTGFTINLPATEIGTLKVVGFFGDTETNEGSVTEIVSGSVVEGKGLYVAEKKGTRQ